MTALRPSSLSVLLLSCVSTLGAFGQGFSTAPVLPVAGDPQLLATGDFNKDGKPDLAYLDAATGGNLHILLGNGDGSFRAGQVIAIPANVGGQIDVADMNGDGIPDLLLNASGVTTLLGRGDGTFAAPVTTPTGSGNTASGHLAIADFDGDGKLDVFTITSYSPTILKGDGKDGFAGTVSLSSSYLSGPDAFAVDLNGDGLPDLLAANGSFGFSVALNRGNGAFGAFVSYTIPQFSGARPLAVTDVNGDGHPDVILPGLYTNPGQLIAALGHGDGTFATAAAFAPTGLHAFNIVGTADLHGDGKPRVFLAGTEGYGTVLGNSPAGSPMFEGSGIRPEQTVLADFNGDGILDMATPDSHAIVILLGRADGTFASTQAKQVGSTVGNLVLADANGDGIPDLLASSSLVFAGNGDGTFATTPLNPPSGYGTTSFSGGDTFPFYPANFNGDNKLDLLDLPEAFLLGNGNGTFTQASKPRIMGTPFYYGAVADFDGDGLDDGVEIGVGGAPPPLGGVNIFMSKAQAFYQFSLPNSEEAGPVATGDFNRDGCADLAVLGIQHLVLYQGDCHGNLAHTVSYSLGLPSSPVSTPFNNSTDIAKADIDGDGHTDLIVTLPTLSQALIFYGNGDGTFTQGSPLTLSHAAMFVSAADLDGDGYADLVFSGIGDPILLYGSASRTFGPERVLAAGFQSGKVALGDLRSIGTTDLVFPNLNTYNYQILNTLGFTYARFLNSAQAPGTGAVTASLALPSGAIPYASAAVVTVSLTATNNAAVPTGFVSLSIDGVPSGSAALNASGVATLPLNAVDAGGHTLTVTYLGDTTFRTAAATGSATVTPLATALALTSTPNPATTLQPVSLNATVSATGYVPGGQVQFSDGAAALGSATLNGSGVATLVLPSLPAGTHTLTASFSATQDLLASQAIASQVVTLAPSSSSLTVTPTASAFGAPVSLTVTIGGGTATTLPTGQVTCTDGAIALGSATLTSGSASLSTTALPTGATSVACTYAGDTVFASSNSASVAVNVTQRYASTVTLSLSAAGKTITTVAAGTPVTLTAQVNANGAPVPTGQVLFCDGSTTAPVCTDIHRVGQAQLSATGTAALTLTPAPGTHTYTARFLGLASSLPMSSPNASLTVTGNVLSTATLSSTGTPGNYTLTAQLTGSIAPTGSVDFLDTSNNNAKLGTTSLTTNATSGSFLPGTLATPAPVGPVRSADFNGDGHPDLALATGPNGGVQILLGNGDGTFSTGQTLQSLPGVLTAHVGELVVGDFNNDGYVDVAAFNTYDKTLAVFLGNGDGTFHSTPIRNSDPSIIGVFSFVVADINGDGFLDIVGANESNNSAAILLGNGDGTFRNMPGPGLAGSPRLVISGDFNEDGIPDLAVSTGQQGTLTVLLGVGDGTFTQAPTPAAGYWPISVVAADLNGDGHLDLAVTNDGNNTVTVLLGKGDGTFQAQNTTYPTDNVPIAIAAGDFNGDGKVDLAVTNELGNTVTLLLGNGDGSFATSIVTTGKQPEFLVATDLNGDGRADLVVGNVGENDATLLLAQGSASAVASLANVGPLGGTTHQVQASYAGDANYSARLTNTVPLVAQTTSTTLTLTATPVQSTFGQAVTLTATLAPASITGTSSDGETIAFSAGAAALGTCTLKSGVCSITVSTLNAGSYSVMASYPGDSALSASTAAPIALTVQPGPASISLAVDNYTFGDAPFSVIATSLTGGPFTFAIVSGPATVSGGNITLTGAGTVTLSVTQPASGNYAATTKTVAFTVAPASQTVQLTAPATATFGAAPVTLTAKATSGLPVTLSVLSGPATLSGTALSFTGAGAVVIAADQPGNTNYNAATQVRQAIQVGPATVALAWPSALSLTYGNTLQTVLNASAAVGTSPVAGTYTYTLAGTPVTRATVPNAGSYTLSLQFTPTDTTSYTGATATASLTVAKASSSLILSAPTASLFTGNALLLTATVNSPAATPPGTVTFLNGTTVLGTGTLTAGAAQLSVASLPAGTQTLTATFAGTANFLGSTSAPVSETVTDFSLTTPTQTPVVTATGSTATTTFAINATGQVLPSAVTFSASGLPPGATATFSPASLPAGSTATSVTVTFTLPTSTAQTSSPHRPYGIAFALLILLPAASLRSRRRLLALSRGSQLCLVAAAGLTALLLGTSGCAGSPSSPAPTPTPTSKSYTVTLTATSGTLQRSTTVTLNVN